MKDFIIPNLDEKTQKKLLGFRGLFIKGEKRESYLASKIVSYTIKEYKKSGKELSKEQIDKIKFAYDPIFKQNVINSIHKDCDSNYLQAIKACENEINSLKKARAKEISKLEDKRWEKIIIKELKFNSIEGKISIYNSIVLFSDITNAEIKITESYRTESEEKGNSKKRASLGGAVAGALVAGGVGAVVGGTVLGKTTHKSKIETQQIPTASYVGVVIDINGFKNEIALLTKTVDQDSHKYKEAIEDAQKIISKLQYLSSIPVPKTYLSVEEEASVVTIDKDISLATIRLEEVKANTPKYEIPEKYL